MNEEKLDMEKPKVISNTDNELEQLRKEKIAFEKEKKEFEKLKADKTKGAIDNIMKPVMARKKDRIKKILSLSQAKHEKIMRGNAPFWSYTPPTMHIAKLQASYNNGLVKISYFVYLSDKKGNKIIKEHKAKVTDEYGNERTIVASANYVFKKYVVETIEDRKPIKIEEFDENVE